MVALTRRERKELYFRRFGKILSNYEKCFVVNADNVRSQQMQQIRMALRGSAEVVFGKNTQMRKIINKVSEKDERLQKLLPLMRQNVGLVFTVRDLHEVRKSLESNRLEAPAKAGAIAPKDVFVPAMNTGLGPEKTSFFQALSIQTKITRGTIEILNEVPLITKGNKVGASEAKLLQMLKIWPFDYGLVIKHVYDAGSVYGADVLDITTEDVLERFTAVASNLTALSLGISYPTFASVPHSLINGFKDLLSLSIATDYTFEQSEKIKEYLKDPSKFAVAAAPAAAAPAASAAASGGAKAEAKAPEPESESDSDLGMGLFD